MKRLTFFFLLATPVCVFAQSNYRDGYIIKSNGDTLKGYINYQEWSYSPQDVEFKTSLNDVKPKDLNPGDIRGFGVVNSETYISFTGLISMNKNVFPNIPSRLDTTRQPGAIFMKLLATGDYLTLFANSEVNKNRFFIEEKNSVPVELNYYEYYGDSGTEVTDNLYRGQLILYAYKYHNGDKKLLDAIPDVKFEEQDLVRMADEINNNQLDARADSADHSNKKSMVRFYGGVGMNSVSNRFDYTVLVSTTNNVSPVFGTSHSSSLKPKFDLGLDVFINPDIQQFIFRTELAGSVLGGQMNVPATANSPGIDMSFSGYDLTLTPQFLYSVYNTESLKIYVDGGVGFRITSYGGDSNGNNQVYVVGPSTGLYFPLQAGIIFNKKFELSFTYTSFTTTASYLSVYVSNKISTGIGLKLFFN